MKAVTDAAVAARQDGTAIDVGAVKIAATPPVLVWGGYGTLEIAGETYLGIGDRGLVEIAGSALGNSEQNVTLTLSGVEPDILALWNAAEVQGAACQIWILTFDGAGQTMLDAQLFTAGRLDLITVNDQIGSTSTISASIETAARGLGRSGQRMRTDADQRLIDPSDGGFKSISFAGNKTLYWGGELPTSASTLGWTPLNTPSAYGGYSRI